MAWFHFKLEPFPEMYPVIIDLYRAFEAEMHALGDPERMAFFCPDTISGNRSHYYFSIPDEFTASVTFPQVVLRLTRAVVASSEAPDLGTLAFGVARTNEWMDMPPMMQHLDRNFID